MNTRSKPVVTVLMPVYNGGGYLRAAIESVLSQTFTDLEFLIIDDGSKDGSDAVIAEYAKKDPRITPIFHAKNMRLIATLNEGLGLAKGTYVARMDCDDLSLPTRLERQVEFMEAHPDHLMVGSDAIMMDKDSNDLFYHATILNDEAIRPALAVTNCFIHGAVMLRKEIFQVIEPYLSHLTCVEDYELWIRLAQQGKCANLPEPLYRYRINESGAYLSNLKNIRRLARQFGQAYWRTFGSGGPAPKERWDGIWDKKAMATLPVRGRRKTLTNLHISFCLEYARKGNIWLALQHLQGANRTRPDSLLLWGKYLVSLLLERILPIKLTKE